MSRLVGTGAAAPFFRPPIAQPEHRLKGGHNLVRHVPVVAVALFLSIAAAADAATPGANGKIAFSRADGIYVVHADGTGPTQISTSHVPSGDAAPQWSPDGSRIAFLRWRDGNPDVYVMNADGSGQADCTPNPAHDNSPDWSPDGLRLAFQSNRGNADPADDDLYVMNAADCGIVPPARPAPVAANHPVRENGPTWSPDGARIVYTHSTFFADHQLFTMSPDGANQALLEPSVLPINSTGADWSPDGQRIGFSGVVPGSPAQIYLINADGRGRLTLLTREQSGPPTWSPDGMKIAFARPGALHVMNADGTKELRVIETLSGNDPDWGPGRGPNASFAPSPSTASAGERVTFDGGRSGDPDGTIASFRWDLDGNGSFETDTGATPSAERAYPAADTLTVGLRVRDHDGNADTTTRTLTVRSRPPSAFLAVSPNPVFTGRPVTFDGSTSRDADGTVVNYRWDLDGDGSFETDTGTRATATRSYRRAATITVRLRVTDNDGNTNEGVGALGARRLTILSRRISAVTSLRFRGTRSGIKVRSLAARNVPRGARIELRCRRSNRRACRPQVRKTGVRATRTVGFPRLRQRRLQAGTVLEIRLMKPGHVGKYIRYTVMRGGLRKAERCLEPASRAPRRECR